MNHMKNSKQVHLGRGLLSISAVIAVFLLAAEAAHAQQTTGVLCSQEIRLGMSPIWITSHSDVIDV